jgi:hypothetical protein
MAYILQQLALDGVLGGWVAQPAVTIFNQAIVAPGTYDCSQLVDMRNSKRLTLKAISTLDADVLIQVIGNMDDNIAGADDINSPIACPAGGSCTIGLAWGDWMNYIGCRIIVSAPPASGNLNIRVVTQN